MERCRDSRRHSLSCALRVPCSPQSDGEQQEDCSKPYGLPVGGALVECNVDCGPRKRDRCDGLRSASCTFARRADRCNDCKRNNGCRKRREGKIAIAGVENEAKGGLDCKGCCCRQCDAARHGNRSAWSLSAAPKYTRKGRDRDITGKRHGGGNRSGDRHYHQGRS